MQSRWIFYTANIAVMLSLVVLMLGAYTRLTHAGLGCPDWPGCYGHLLLPEGGEALTNAQNLYPEVPIEKGKAWTEMIHRYAAGSLGLLIIILSSYAGITRLCKVKSLIPIPIALALLLLLAFQAALGMWTVTLKLLPVVVMGHLLGGILLFTSLVGIRLCISDVKPVSLPSLHKAVGFGLLLVFCQIALGGWVSANYAGIACIGFPRCNGQWLPSLHLMEGFNLDSLPGANYQGGLLENGARVTIQFIHRIGAVITFSYIFGLAVAVLKKLKLRHKMMDGREASPHSFFALTVVAILLILFIFIQFSLGIMNVIYLLPLPVAVAHNAVAALLMANMWVLFCLTKTRTNNAAK